MKKILIPIIAAILVIAMIVVIFVVNKNKQENNNNDDTVTCTEHVDENKDGLCDLCRARMPIGSNQPSQDVTDNVNNAAELFNDALNIVTSNEKRADLSNITFTGLLAEELELYNPSNTQIDVKDNVVHLRNEIDGQSIDKYIVFNNEGLYTVVYDGTTYTYELNPSIIVPGVTVKSISPDDITYMSSGEYFKVSSEYINEFMKAYMNSFMMSIGTLENELGMNGMSLVFKDAVYSAQFKVSPDSEIQDLYIKGIVTKNDTETEVVVINATTVNKTTTIDITLNMELVCKMSFVLDSKDGSDTEFSINANMSLIFPEVTGIDALDLKMTADLVIPTRQFVISSELQKVMDDAYKSLKYQGVVAQKYAGNFLIDDDTCDLYAVYDEEYKVYVYFVYDWNNESDNDYYIYHSFSEEKDIYACLVNIDMNTKKFVIKEHSQMESIEGQIFAKYSGDFFADYECRNIIVYDEEFNVYVLFARDIFNHLKFNVFGISDENDTENYCTATVDMASKHINITSHGKVELAAIKYENLVFDVSGVTDCSILSVHDEELDLYFIFEYNEVENGWINYGYMTMQLGCLAEADITDRVLTVIEHSETLIQ